MNRQRLATLARILRIRQRLTQAEVAARATVGRHAVSALERAQVGRLKIRDVDAVFAALGARIDVRVMWNGPELDRMLDAAHAWLAARLKSRLERWGWIVRVEVSYSQYGERGRIDLLAWHPATRLSLVVEIKTALVDVQQLLGSLDVKCRLARDIAKQFGWDIRSVIPAIVFAEHRTTRRRLAELDTLFDRFALRGRSAISWLRSPESSPSGALWFARVPSNIQSVAAQQRVRQRRYERRRSA